MRRFYLSKVFDTADGAIANFDYLKQATVDGYQFILI